jgi:hypothetical protein
VEGQKDALTRDRFEVPSGISDEQDTRGDGISRGESDRPGAAKGALSSGMRHRIRQHWQGGERRVEYRLGTAPPPPLAGKCHAHIGNTSAKVSNATIQVGPEVKFSLRSRSLEAGEVGTDGVSSPGGDTQAP